MKKNLFLILLPFLFGFFFLLTGFYSSNQALAQSCPANVPDSCVGSIYCNGPCDTLWYKPCNCSCNAQVCTGTTYCPGDPGYNEECPQDVKDAYECCTRQEECSSTTETFDCPDWINPCLNVCDGNGGGGNGGGGGASCTVSVSPSNQTIGQGASYTFTASVSPSGGTVDRVDFVSDNETVATVDPSSDNTEVYSTQVTGETPGSTSINALVIMGGSNRCSDSGAVDVNAAGPWWRVIDADVTAGGNITSTIPSISFDFDLDGPGGFPGIPIFGGSLNLGNGGVSSTGWQANATFNDARTYSYAWFSRLIPAEATMNEISSASIQGGDITSGGTEYNGYYWYHFDGDSVPGGTLTITDSVVVAGDRKVILLVENGNLVFEGDQEIQSDGLGFFMTIVGETEDGSRGNIAIDPAVTGVEGLFVADNSFSTGTSGSDSDSQITVRGSVATYGGVSLQRDLLDDSTTPAEVFEYAPELMLLYPSDLSLERLRWQEVAP